MTLTLTPKTEAMLLARAEDEGQDVNTLADTLLADLLAHDDVKSSDEPAAVTNAGAMSDEMRAAAKMLADFAREAEPAIKKILLFSSAKNIRLLYVDPTALPADEDAKLSPYYFRPSPNNGIQFESAVALILPEEEGHLTLPNGWGSWDSAETLWKQE